MLLSALVLVKPIWRLCQQAVLLAEFAVEGLTGAKNLLDVVGGGVGVAPQDGLGMQLQGGRQHALAGPPLTCNANRVTV